jgi:peroxiredoxin Q/BCP
VIVLGISTDPRSENLLFKQEQRIPYPLLSDPDRQICMAYGACSFRHAYYANRITYVIDEQGLIQKVYSHVDPTTHADEILAAL